MYGTHFLSVCDYVAGSPTAFADQAIETKLREAAAASLAPGVYIPSGALWGATDLQKMDELGTLKALTITMRKHPGSFKLNDAELTRRCESAKEAGAGPVEVYNGPARALCPLAPNNVNTIAAAALAAPSLGFDGVVGVVIADASLAAHIVEVDAVGPGNPPFTIRTVRDNPAQPGAVTGNATYNSFLSSLLRSGGRGPGFHFC
jgi:aspartate dehydrogenase